MSRLFPDKKYSDKLTQFEIDWHRDIAKLIVDALKIALSEMSKKAWIGCCKQIIDFEMETYGMCAVKRPQTLSDYHRRWHLNGEYFSNPAALRSSRR